MTREIDIDDPNFRAMVVGLFTDIAILEHLIRVRFEPETPDADARQFGVLNYLVRQGQTREKIKTLAWCFQVADADMEASVAQLAAGGYVGIEDEDGARHVRLTEAGREKHRLFVERAAPEVIEVLSDIDSSALYTTAETLREIRRTFDNLPGR